MDRFEDECLRFQQPGERVDGTEGDRDAAAGADSGAAAQDLYALLVLEQWLRRWGV